MSVVQKETIVAECFPDKEGTDLLPEALSVAEIAKSIREHSDFIDEEIARIFASAEESAIRRANQARVTAFRDGVLADLGATEKGKQLRTFADIRSIAHKVRQREMNLGTEHPTLKDKQLAPRVLTHVRTAITQTFAELRKKIGKGEPAKKVAEKFGDVAAPLNSDTPKNVPIMPEKQSAEVPREDVNVLSLDKNPVALKASVLLQKMGRDTLKTLKVDGKTILLTEDTATKQHSHLLSEYWMYLLNALTQIADMRNKSMSVQYALRQAFSSLRGSDLAKHRIFEQWTSIVLPGVINWDDLKTEEMEIAPSLWGTNDGSIFLDADHLLMPKKHEHMQMREKDPSLVWPLTQQEKAAISAIHTAERANNPRPLAGDSEFLRRTAEKVNAQCNGGLLLVRAEQEVHDHIQIIDDIHFKKNEAPVVAEPLEPPAQSDTRAITPDTATLPAVAIISDSPKEVDIPATTTDAVSVPRVRKQRKPETIDREDLSLLGSMKRALGKMEMIANKDLGRSDQFMIALVKLFYAHLQRNVAAIESNPSSATAFDESAAQFLLSFVNEEGKDLFVEDARKTGIRYMGEPEDFLYAAGQFLERLQEKLPADAGISESFDDNLLQKIESITTGELQIMINHFADKGGYEDLKGRKVWSQALLIEIISKLEAVEESIKRHQTLPEGISERYVLVLLEFCKTCNAVYAVNAETSELDSMKPAEDYMQHGSALLETMQSLLATDDQKVLNDPALVTESASVISEEETTIAPPLTIEQPATVTAPMDVPLIAAEPDPTEDAQIENFRNTLSSAEISESVIPDMSHGIAEPILPAVAEESQPYVETGLIAPSAVVVEGTLITPSTIDTAPATEIAPSISTPVSTNLSVPLLKAQIASAKTQMITTIEMSAEMQQLPDMYVAVCTLSNKLRLLEPAFPEDQDLQRWMLAVTAAETFLVQLFEEERPQRSDAITSISLSGLGNEVARIEATVAIMQAQQQELRRLEAQEQSILRIEDLQNRLAAEIVHLQSLQNTIPA